MKRKYTKLRNFITMTLTLCLIVSGLGTFTVFSQEDTQSETVTEVVQEPTTVVETPTEPQTPETTPETVPEKPDVVVETPTTKPETLTQTEPTITPVEEPEIIARVWNPVDMQWYEFSWLENHDSEVGAFNYANTLSGDVIVELLKKGYNSKTDVDDTDGRYTLSAPVFFNGAGLTSITLRTSETISVTGVLQRGYDGGSLFTSNKTVRLGNIIIDGNRDNFTSNANGGLFNITKDGSLLIYPNTILRNSASLKNGGAIYSAGDVAMSGGIISNCIAANGGAVYMDKETNFVIKGTAEDKISFLKNQATDTVKINENNVAEISKVRGGGAIFLQTDATLTAEYTKFIENLAYNPDNKGEDYTQSDKDQDGFGGAICCLGKSVSLEYVLINGHHEDLDETIRNAAKGGAIYMGDGLLYLKNCKAYNCYVCLNETTVNSGHFGGLIYNSSGDTDKNGNTVVIQHCVLDGHYDTDATYLNARDGGMVYINKGRLYVEETDIQNFSSFNKGGAIYSWTADLYIKDSRIHGCAANTGDSPSGGAISNGSATTGSLGGELILDHVYIYENLAAMHAGGVYTRQNMTIKNGTIIGSVIIDGVTHEGNKSLNTSSTYVGGVYMTDGKTLIVGDINTPVETSRIYGNTTANGVASNVRLSEITSGDHKGKNDNKVYGKINSMEFYSVLGQNCLIGVSNPKVLLWQFGEIVPDALAGMDCLNPEYLNMINIKGDSGKLIGKLNPNDPTGKQVIWYGEIVCRIVDADGYVLSKGGNATVYGTLSEAFAAYKAGGMKDLSGTTNKTPARIEMLVDVYEMTQAITTSGITITITTAPTAAQDKKNSSAYCYQGENPRSRITKAASFPKSTKMFTFSNQNDNITWTNIILGGESENAMMTAEADGAVLRLNGSSKVFLSDNATIQYVNNKNKGIVQIEIGTFTMNSPTAVITSCIAAEGGAVLVNSATANFNLQNGVIENNKAKYGGGVRIANGGHVVMDNGIIRGNVATDQYSSASETFGGGINCKKGTIVINGGKITENYATTVGNYRTYGGGIFLNGADVTLTLNGGEITRNYAESLKNGGNSIAYGGGIYAQAATIVHFKGGKIEGNYTYGSKNSIGGGICMEAKNSGDVGKGRLYIYGEGNPSFGSGNFVSTDYSSDELKNGGEEYPSFTIGTDTRPRPRQDIFIADTTKVSPIINIMSNFTKPINGSFWVWAQLIDESKNISSHTRNEQQFALMKANENITDATLHIFRNARNDEVTANTRGNTRYYLTGVRNKDDGTDLNIYWGYQNLKSGARLVLIKKGRKDDAGNHTVLTGGLFDIHEGKQIATLADDLTANSQGFVFSGTLPYGIYTIHERAYPAGVTGPANGLWFYLIVEKDRIILSDTSTLTQDASYMLAEMKQREIEG